MERDDLLKKKIHVPTEAISRKVQERLFEFDCRWTIGGKKVRLLSSKYLFIDGDGDMSKSDNREHFVKKSYEELDYDELIDEPNTSAQIMCTDTTVGLAELKRKFGIESKTRKETLAKYKLGDKIKVIGSYDVDIYGEYIGEIKEVTRVLDTDSNDIWYKLTDNFEDLSFREDDLQLVQSTKSEENKMEQEMEIKNCDKKNLKEAVKKVTEERMNAEVEFAANKYRNLVDSLDSVNRTIKTYEERKAELEKDLKEFK